MASSGPSDHKNEEMIAIAKTMKHIPWCEEYEKMISGMLYDSYVPDLEAARFKARRWCHKYNNWFPEEGEHVGFRYLAAEREKQLADIVGECGKDVFIEPPFTVDYGCNVRLGERMYANFNLCILDCGLVTIGARTMFGPNCSLFAATHEVEVQSRRDNIEFAREIVIGDDCWIGGHVVILPGVTIGDGCTIGAGSVVTKDIPAWSVAIGTPARVVKKVKPVDPLPGDKEGSSTGEKAGN